MGLGYEQCQKLNPKLIYTSITGYGQTGPFREAPGYDVVVEAEAGLMHMCDILTNLLIRMMTRKQYRRARRTAV
jgi:hypothetical protein